jgi:hypothetical protein
MKKIFLLSALVCLFAFSKAQGNLQFNQVIHYVLQGGTPQNITVPAGKVWKIEAASVPELYLNLYLRNASNQNIAIFPFSSSYNQCLPYWLPGGFTGNFFYNYVGYRASVSILEFNIVP